MTFWIIPGYVSACMAIDHGIWWIRIPLGVAALKAPWNAPLFSERYGFKRRLPLGFGWRLLFFRPTEAG